MLRTNLLYSSSDAPPKSILLTSAGRGEGKSTTCANLGVVLAQIGKDTLVVDCDFRSPAQHRIFGLSNTWGIENVLLGDRSLQEVWSELMQGLKVVTSGPPPPDPAVVLGSQAFAAFLASARAKFDFVLLDSPPILAVADPVILGAQVDGVLLVVDSRATHRRFLKGAVRSLDTVGAPVLGTVMNKVGDSKDSYYSYYSS